MEHHAGCALMEKTGDQCTCIEDSCGCVFCDIDLKPCQLLGQWWHKNPKSDFQPARCYRLSQKPKE